MVAHVLFRALSIGLIGRAAGQTASLYELTAKNFMQAAQQPITWLLQLESGMSGGVTASTMLQAAEYYHVRNQQKGIRVGRVNLLQYPELRRVLCEYDCPALVAYKLGHKQVRIPLPGSPCT